MSTAITRPVSSHAAAADARRDAPILLALTRSPDCATATRAAADLAKALGVGVHVIHSWIPMNTAFGPAGQPSIDLELAYEQPAAEVLRSAGAHLRSEGVEVLDEHLVMGLAADEIVAVAAGIGARLVVTGSRGLGLIKRLVLGSVSQGVVNASTAAPVLVVRNGDHAWPPERILVGYDGSTSSRRAAESGAEIANATGAEVVIVTVVTPDVLMATLPGEAAKAAALMVRAIADELAETHGIAIRTEVLTGDTIHNLLSMAATSSPTLVAVGSRGDGLLRRVALGSVSMAILHAADGPVLISH